jgi:hypothetical protein
MLQPPLLRARVRDANGVQEFEAQEDTCYACDYQCDKRTAEEPPLLTLHQREAQEDVEEEICDSPAKEDGTHKAKFIFACGQRYLGHLSRTYNVQRKLSPFQQVPTLNASPKASLTFFTSLQKRRTIVRSGSSVPTVTVTHATSQTYQSHLFATTMAAALAML